MNLSDVIENFWAYKPNQDISSVARTDDLFNEFRERDDSANHAPISTFASIVNCPYRIVNIGMGHRPRFSRSAIGRMNKGTSAHRKAEKQVRAKAAASAAAGGPPDWTSAPKSTVSVAAKDLLETPEVRVALTAEKLGLRGKADGLLRSGGIVVAVERKPRTRMYHPASTLQAMSYAIGGCLSLETKKASDGAEWTITSYSGSSRRGGSITENVCELVRGLGQAYSKLLQLGSSGERIPELPGPGPGKCVRCEFRTECRFAVEYEPRDPESAGEPIWAKYAKRKNVDD